MLAGDKAAGENVYLIVETGLRMWRWRCLRCWRSGCVDETLRLVGGQFVVNLPLNRLDSTRLSWVQRMKLARERNFEAGMGRE